MIVVNGARLAYEERGEGLAIVFSHAAVADRRMWDHQFEHLASSYRVVRYDWRGYGESQDAEGVFSHSDDLKGLLDVLDIDRAVLVGCSMGGGHCVDVALAAPERVAGLVVFCAGLTGHVWPEEMQEYVRKHVRPAVPADRLAAYTAREHDERPAAPTTAERTERPAAAGWRQVLREDARAMAEAHGRFLVAGPERDPESMDPAVWAKAMDMAEKVFRRLWSGPPSTERVPQPPGSERLAEVRAKTLVVNGLADAPWIQELQTRIAAEIPGARKVDLADTGHLPPLERAAEATALIREHAQ